MINMNTLKKPSAIISPNLLIAFAVHFLFMHSAIYCLRQPMAQAKKSVDIKNIRNFSIIAHIDN